MIFCKNEQKEAFDGKGKAEEVAASKYLNNAGGLKALGKDLRFNRKLLEDILPTDEECALIGETEDDARGLANYRDLAIGTIPEEGLGAKDFQTELIVQSGTTDEMKAGSEKNLYHFVGFPGNIMNGDAIILHAEASS